MKKFFIFIISLLLIIIIGIFVAYAFRASLIQSAGPLVADQLGMEIAELDIETLNTREIAIPRFKARYFSQGKIIDAVIDRLVLQIDPWAGPRHAVKSVSVEHIELTINATNDTSAADASDVPLIDLIRSLPSAAFIADHIVLTYQATQDDVLFYEGSAVRDQDTVAIRGMFVDPGNISAKVDLNIKQNAYFDLNIAPTDSDDSNLHFKGEVQVDDDWLLLDGSGGLKVAAVNSYLGHLNITLPLTVASVDGQFDLKLEADLGLTADNIVQSVAAKFNVDATSQLSAKDYSIDAADLDIRAECIVAASKVADCLFRQPIAARLAFASTPQWVLENFSWHENKFSLELIPSDELALKMEWGEVRRFKGHGSVRMNARANTAPLAVNTLLTGITLNGGNKAWNLDGTFDVELNASNLTTPSVDVSRAIVDMRGRLKATDKSLQAQLLKGSKIIAQKMNSPEFAADKIELTQKNNALVRYDNISGQLESGDINYSLRPMQLQNQWASVKMDSSQLRVEKLAYADDQWQTQANFNSGKVEVVQPHVSVIIYDMVSDLSLKRDKLLVEGIAAIGRQRSALQFEGRHDLNGENGDAAISINSFPLAQNDLVKKLIATTGLPLQFKRGAIAMDVAAEWGPLLTGETAAQVTLGIENVAGDYAQNQFEGLNTLVKLNESNGWYLAQPLAVTIDSVNVGVPVTDISFGFDRIEKADDKQPIVKLSELSAQVLDGSVYAKNIKVDLNQPVNEFSIYLFNLSLEKLLALNQTEDLVASGSFDGELPIRIESDNFSIHAGWLKADENGGVLKYNRIEEVLVGNPNLELVAGLLKDFRYNEMSAQVDLQPDGSVILATKLHGRSPHSEFDKQVNLNFNIEFNLWKFLESARLLTRIDQDIGQQIISKQRDN